MARTDVKDAGSAMLRSLIRILVIIGLGSFTIIALLPVANTVRSGKMWSASFVVEVTLLIGLAILASVAFYYALKKIGPFIDSNAQEQARFLDGLNPKWADVAIL